MANIWDTAGQEKMNAISKQFYRGSDGCVIVFDLTDKSSFNDVEKWVDGFLLHSASNARQIPYILIGNKSDLKEKVVIRKEAIKESVKMNGFIEYFETSAKEIESVDDAFNYIINKAVETMPVLKPNTSILTKISLKSQEERKTKGCCK